MNGFSGMIIVKNQPNNSIKMSKFLATSAQLPPSRPTILMEALSHDVRSLKLRSDNLPWQLSDQSGADSGILENRTTILPSKRISTISDWPVVINRVNIGNISLATRSGQREQLQVGCLCLQESRTWNLLQTSRTWTNKILPQPLSKATRLWLHKEQGRGCQKVKSQGPFQSRVQSKFWTGVKAFHSWTVIRGVVLGGKRFGN